MPNRIVRDAILTSEKVCSLGWPEEVFYRRLMSIVDDYGRHEANPQLLRAKCYPLQTDAVRVADISRWMAACQMAGLVVLYEASGKQYLEISNFGQQRRAASKCPDPPAFDISCSQVISDAHLVVFGVEDVRAPPKGAPLVLPEWLPVAQWEAFVAMRKAKGKRAPFTDAAKAGILRELDKLRKEGHDPAAVLEASVINGWSGVFPLKSAPPRAQRPEDPFVGAR